MIENQWVVSEAWKQGVRAALIKDHPKNPYERKTKDWAEFIDGFNHVQQFQAFSEVARELAEYGNPPGPAAN